MCDCDALVQACVSLYLVVTFGDVCCYQFVLLLKKLPCCQVLVFRDRWSFVGSQLFVVLQTLSSRAVIHVHHLNDRFIGEPVDYCCSVDFLVLKEPWDNWHVFFAVSVLFCCPNNSIRAVRHAVTCRHQGPNLQNILRFVVRSTYDSDLKCAKTSFRNIVS